MMKQVLKGISLAGVLVMVTAYFVFPAVLPTEEQGISTCALENQEKSYLLPGTGHPSVPSAAAGAAVVAVGLGGLLSGSVASDLRVLRWYQNKKGSSTGETVCDPDDPAPCVDPGLAYS